MKRIAMVFLSAVAFAIATLINLNPARAEEAWSGQYIRMSWDEVPAPAKVSKPAKAGDEAKVREDLEIAQRQVTTLQARVEELSVQLKAKDDALAAARAEVDGLRTEIQRLAGLVSEKDAEIAKMQTPSSLLGRGRGPVRGRRESVSRPPATKPPPAPTPAPAAVVEAAPAPEPASATVVAVPEPEPSPPVAIVAVEEGASPTEGEADWGAVHLKKMRALLKEAEVSAEPF